MPLVTYSFKVYQLNADVLTSLIRRENEGCLRFEIHEIRNLTFRYLPDNPLNVESTKKSKSLYPGKSSLFSSPLCDYIRILSFVPFY